MSNFNFGHSKIFWEEIMYSIDKFEDLSPEERKITLVSPYIRDIGISTSNMSSDEWAEVLGMPGTLFSNLSDVLIGLSYFGFKIVVLTLDSSSKGLPKEDRNHLVREEKFVKKLIGDGTNTNLRILKKKNIHNKLYCFPWSVLLGSVNMTNRGMLGNNESLKLISREDNESEFLECLVNLNAIINGAEDYAYGTVVRVDDLENERLFEKINQQIDDEKRQEEGRIFSMGVELPESDENLFLSDEERYRMKAEIDAFEIELRQFLLNYYRKYGHEVKDWLNKGYKNPAKHWHKLVKINEQGETLHNKAGNVIKAKKLRPSDIPGGRVPNYEDLTADEAVMKGTTLGDLRVALLGIITDGLLPLEDYGNADLSDRGVIRLTSDLRKNKSTKADAQLFWSKYFGPTETAFDYLYWVRRNIAHPDPISSERANAANHGMSLIRRVIFKPWYEKHKGDTLP